ncbi:MYG1 exonuclease-like [Uloborus diversus]|uniref:MYG1 exonuclease-like n=1 Tax=Uloborus diversus TaxID=327109 RepID=UPI00240A922E|nr:MYG1 exonuclease-like [Uloborus diversus]XP_054716624.1 MYG1 exonuclease-like [Uloborus diversus]XP_054716633.1 MYG1 exonuclease-like [Uloborus diversus]
MLKSFFNISRSFFLTPNSRYLSSMGKIKIGTHSGTFHCDEVLACSMLKHADSKYHDAEIVRSRDMKVLDECDIVVDVGGVYDPETHRYDHHQRSFDHNMNSLNQDYPWTIKLSSAGLVYYHFGHQIISKILGLPADSENVNVLFHKVYENFVQEIDAIDNGIDSTDKEPRYKIHTHLSARVKHLNPSWNEKNPDENACFQNASKLVETEFLDRVHFYGKVWLPARDIVKKAIMDRSKVHPSEEIVEFENGGCPWKEHLFEIEESLKIEKPIKFVIYTDTLGLWRVQCVSVSPFSFENRLSLKKEWRGLRDEELSEVSGIPGCTFVHSSGFIGGNKTREGALRMALDTLNLIK